MESEFGVFVLMVQAGGSGVMFSWDTLGLLVQIEHWLNATAYLSIVADHIHPVMTTVYPSSGISKGCTTKKYTTTVLKARGSNVSL